MTTQPVLFAPGAQAHYDYLIAHRARVEAGEIPAPVSTMANLAEHEAAHATVAVLLGVPFDEVVVLPMRQWRRGEPAGWARAEVTGASREDVLIRGCAVLWAGAVADGHLYGSSHDIASIVQGSSLLPERKQGLPFSVAADLVTRFRPAINAVAARLVDTGRLPHAEVVRIVHAAINPN